MERHNITITWSDGDQTTTDINGSRMEICKHYENAVFVKGYESADGWKEYKVNVASLHFNY